MNAFSVILAKAAREAGSAAERDYNIASGGDGGVGNALVRTAWERLGVPADKYPSEVGVTREQCDAEVAKLQTEIAGQWAAHREHARSRAYTGWSNYSTGPVRYAN